MAINKSKRTLSRILIADDSITVQKVVHVTLASSAYEVVAAADGPDALIKIRNLKPEVAFVACELPQVDGYQICETIRKDPALKSTRLVLLRTNAQKDAVTKGRAVGADEILLKPFDGSQLLRCLDIVKHREASSESTEVRRPLVQATADERREDSTTLSLKELVEQNSEISAAPLPPSEPSENWGPKAEAEIRAWVEKNMPSLAEKLLKEEIAKILSSH